MDAIRKRSLWMVAVGLVLAAAWATPAGAQATAAPPLTGTELLALDVLGTTTGTIEITGNCDPPFGQPEITWTATGIASGTYTGPYTETGTATLVDAPVGSFTFTAEFTIDSPIGFVSGTKGVSVPTGSASCGDFGPTQLDVASFFHPNAPYTATITTATGATCTTEGTSQINVNDFTIIPGFSVEIFGETFTTGTPPVCAEICPPDGDDDGDGLTNTNERLFSTLLRNSDSDFDGIADGNDDANGNGEDDEDEDDDEDDGCPDEDSDDDGEDDEDEDDEEDDDDD